MTFYIMDKSKLLSIKLLILIFIVSFSVQLAASQTQLKFTLYSIEGKSETNTWSLVFPNNVMSNASHLSLYNRDGEVIDAAFNETLLWPQKGKKKYLRAIQVTTKATVDTQNYTLKWQDALDSNISTSSNFTSNTHHANLTNKWLTQSYFSPMLEANAYEPFSWFDNANKRYANFVVSPSLMEERKISLQTASPWLYDRVLSLYLLYFKTGDIYWKIKAHQAAITYKNNVDNNGDFYLKPNDMKYSNTQGLLFDYLFYPSQNTLDKISALYNKTKEWQYKIKKQGFWTERHHSIALSAAISYWAIFSDNDSLIRIQSFTKHLLQKLNSNVCLSHPYESHEGRSVNTEVCSPWMTALLIEQLWRFHHLHYSYESVKVISKLSSFLSKEGLFYYTYGKEYSAVPKYLANLNKDIKENNDPWSDIFHACDVASALAKGVYLQKFLTNSDPEQLSSLNLMLKTCHRSMHRSNPNDAWPIVPLRKFNWWYSTTASLTWLMSDLKIKHPRK
jgi:hypothetical protein